jgi:hypothetical protein
MILNNKSQNFKGVDLVNGYNFYIKTIFIQNRMKKDMIFVKLRLAADIWVPSIIST